MKKITIFLLIISTYVHSQVGIGTTNPHSSSVLDIQSHSAGLLIPRLTDLQKDAIIGPANGLLIYQTNGDMGFWYYDAYNYEWLPFKREYSCYNGLTQDTSIFKLGGSLIEQTEIKLNYKDLTLFSDKLGSDFIFKSHIEGDHPSGIEVVRFKNNGNLQTFGANGVSLICSDYDENVFRVGNAPTNVIANSGDAFSIGGETGETDFIAKFSRGGGYSTYRTRGNAVGVGSIEYFIDGELIIASSDTFVPLTDAKLDLGHINNRWRDIYSSNGVIQTSDETLKKQIKPLTYGIKEVLKLKPITYKWKDVMIGNTIKEQHQEEVKIGLSAQNLLSVIPESVSTHHWSAKDEKSNTYAYKKNNKLGVNYTELIPVLIKAIQEQQEEIEILKKKINK